MTSEGQRRLVLTEEDYTCKLSSIVARDFFPDISKLEQQNRLLDCRLKGDAIGAIAVRRASRRSVEDEETAIAQRELDDHDLVESNKHNACPTSSTSTIAIRPTPGSSKKQIRKRPRPLEEETITGFVTRATNEDDDEFDSNLKRDIKENRQRRKDIYRPNVSNSNCNSNNKERSGSYSNLSLEMASDDFAPESNRIEWNTPVMRNGLFFYPTPMRSSSRADHDRIERVNEKKLSKNSNAPLALSNASNTMPPPSKQQTSGMLSIRNARKKRTPQNLLVKSQLVEYVPKHTLEKKIEPSATRFPSKESMIQNIESIKNGILDNTIDSDSDTDYMSSATDVSTDLDAPLRSVEEERRRLKRKREANHRYYVTMTPQIIPGGGDESPITTWGSIDGTPVILSGQEEQLEKLVPSSSFHISSKNKRERAASKAETMLARRVKLASSTSSSSFRSSSSKPKKRRAISETRGLGSLTPVALSLLEKTTSTQLRSRDAFGSALRTSYTPRVNHSSSSSVKRPRRNSNKHRKKDHAFNTTPQR